MAENLQEAYLKVGSKMLTLVSSQSEIENSCKLDVVEFIQPHRFIDDLIAQIKYSHIDEVWNAQMQILIELAGIKQDEIKHFKVL